MFLYGFHYLIRLLASFMFLLRHLLLVVAAAVAAAVLGFILYFAVYFVDAVSFCCHRPQQAIPPILFDFPSSGDGTDDPPGHRPALPEIPRSNPRRIWSEEDEQEDQHPPGPA